MDNKEEMFRFVEQWRDSGLTRRAFAIKNELKVSTFYYWCTKHYRDVLKPSKETSFVEFAELSNPVNENIQPKVELEFPDGLRIKIY